MHNATSRWVWGAAWPLQFHVWHCAESNCHCRYSWTWKLPLLFEIDGLKLISYPDNFSSVKPCGLGTRLRCIFSLCTVSMLHPDWLIGSNFRLRESDNLHTGITKTRGYPRVKTRLLPAVKVILFSVHKPQTCFNSSAMLLCRQYVNLCLHFLPH